MAGEGIDFEWDPWKAEANRQKHGVTFSEASTAFEDPFGISIPDPRHSIDEDRFTLLGRSEQGRILVVMHTDRGNAIRIISARPATPRERRQYEADER